MANDQSFVAVSPTFYEQFWVRGSHKHKKTVKRSVFFALLGSPRIKALRKMLAKSTPRGPNLIDNPIHQPCPKLPNFCPHICLGPLKAVCPSKVDVWEASRNENLFTKKMFKRKLIIFIAFSFCSLKYLRTLFPKKNSSRVTRRINEEKQYLTGER
jgi:hypothetical protein